MTLIGNPTRAAEPITEALMSEYVNWLGYERHRASEELYGRDPGEWYKCSGPAYDWHVERSAPMPPSTRAAIVLSAVGCDWREGGL